MAFEPTNDFLADVAAGKVVGYSIVEKFGHNNDPATASLVDVNILNTNHAFLIAADRMDVYSSSADDNPSAAGAHRIMVEGLDANFDVLTEEIALNTGDGTIAVTTTGSFIRIHRAYVSQSGTYGGTATPSHLGNITIETNGTNVAQVQIDTTNIAVGQTQVARYTIPNGFTGILIGYHVSVDSSKSVDAYLFQRPNADSVASSFTGAMRLVFVDDAVTGTLSRPRHLLGQNFPEKTDIWAAAQAASNNSKLSVDFTILLIDNTQL